MSLQPKHPSFTLVLILVRSCMRSFQKVKREHAALRQKLEAYFQVFISHNLIHCSVTCVMTRDTCRNVVIFCFFVVCLRMFTCSFYDKLVPLELPLGLPCRSLFGAFCRVEAKVDYVAQDESDSQLPQQPGPRRCCQVCLSIATDDTIQCIGGNRNNK